MLTAAHCEIALMTQVRAPMGIVHRRPNRFIINPSTREPKATESGVHGAAGWGSFLCVEVLQESWGEASTSGMTRHRSQEGMSCGLKGGSGQQRHARKPRFRRACRWVME